jgi:arylsulfatase A-like enzyme
MDDASMDLLPSIASADRMARQGASYSQAFVVDSLCCVSRTVILTGQYPHQTGVRTNVANDARVPVGGWSAFQHWGNEPRAVNTRLRRAGYTTGFVGKYLNQYPSAGRHPRVPSGWSEFVPVLDGAYDEWDFDWGRSTDGSRLSLRHYGAPRASASLRRKDAAYAGVFIQHRALDFIDRHRDDAAPYFLEVAVYAPHSKTPKPGFYRRTPFFPAMFRDRATPANPGGNCGPVSCASLDVTDLPGYADPRGDNRPRRDDGSPAPPWQSLEPIDDELALTYYRDRARMVQSVDRMLRRVLDAVGDDTYVVLTSDNGLHLNQWGMPRGKGTAYDSDIHVPLLVVGPNVVPGVRTGLVSNLDLAPTIEELAGLAEAPYRSGVSYASSLELPEAADRRYVFVEHTWSGLRGSDPDAGVDRELPTVPTYVAVRSADGLLIRYDLDRRPGSTSFAWELYDLRAGAGEATNVFADPAAHELQSELSDRLQEFLSCREFMRDDAVPERCRDLTR